jgi:dipeptidyl aminopeptidase/acylaminoacyl peptidase
MLLIVTDETEEAEADRRAEEDGRDPPARPYVIDRLQFKEDGVGYLDRSRAHIYVQEGRCGPRTQLTRGDFDHSEPAWSPDGTKIAFVSNRTNEPDSNINTDIFVIDAGPGVKARAPRRVSDNPGTDQSPTWSPDGARIAFLSQLDPKLFWYASQHVAIAPAAGGPATILTRETDRNFFSPRFSANGKKIYALLEDSGEQPVVAVDAETGAVTRIVAGKHAVFSFDVDAKGAVAAQLSRPALPDEIFLAEGDALANVSRANDALLAGLILSEPINATFKSADGTEIEGFFYPPTTGRTKRAPAILRIHGGPTSQFDFSFDAYAQVYAAAGYLVVMANPRGSTGYGTPFAAAIFADWGNKDYDDVIAGVDYAIKQGWADGKRLGVGGWSYGGILTNFIITRTKRFKAAVTGASGLNYLANYGHDIYQREYEIELGLPWENLETWEKLNKFARVGAIETPTLIIGGAEDWNVPILNSEQLYQALKRRGVDTGLIVYPDEDHSIDRPSFYRDRFERYRGWYDKYLK